MATSRARTVRRDGSQSDNGNSGSGAADVMKQSRKDGSAVCLETWRLPGELFREDLETRRAAVEAELQPVDFSKPGSCSSLARISNLSEAEIGLHYIIWVTCAMSPALVPFVFWLAGWRKGLVFAAIVGAAMLWPNREWLNPPKSRLGNPIYCVALLKLFIKYFSFRVIAEDPASLFSDENFIVAGTPHGLWPAAFALLGFTQRHMPFRRFIRAAAANVVLRLPLWRQVGLWGGTIPASRTAIESTLRNGDSVMVAVDGIAGMFRAREHPGKEVLLMKSRRGLPRIALRTGTSIVPVVMFGNTSIINSWQDPWGIMEWFSRTIRVSMIVLLGRWGLPIPRRKPITAVFGRPICVKAVDGEPSDAEIAVVHQELIARMVELYEKYQGVCGYDKEVVVV